MARLEIEPEAAADVREIAEFYEQRRPGFGKKFWRRFAAAVNLIAAFPDACPKVRKDVRWILMRQFPFKVFFHSTPEHLSVFAVLHTKREPDSWRKRLSD